MGIDMTSTIEEVTAIVCITVMFLYAMYKVVEFYNPYVDEILEQGEYRNNENDISSGSWYEVKRTYKNGTITYKNIKLK